ncbi:MAG: redoxin domain-containing protein [Gammaproteobacteria bacterium]|nr:redoxin domain-containing protein [Gammaproteobacteria bacterium]MCP5199193.1 redoxin domain-containing protein [Gammaproteobacteria bacterium]
MRIPACRAAVVALLTCLVASSADSADFAPRPRLPEFTAQDPAHWINSAPLSRDDLLGQVVLVDVWTFECWNCYRSFPWLRTLERGFAARGLRVIGIHSPEFEREREPARVRAKVREFELDHPVMIDNDLAYWRALGNRYWPAFYLVDKRGRVRQVFVGETHAGDAQATRIEAQVEKLLAE